MKFAPLSDAIEAVPVDLDGSRLMAISLVGRAHVVCRDVFSLLFQPVVEHIAIEAPTPHLETTPSVAVEKKPAPALAVRKKTPAPRKDHRAAERASGEFDQYPVLLRDPRASSQRYVHDALRVGSGSLHVLVERCKKLGWAEAESGNVMAALCSLRTKGIAKKQDGLLGGDWILS